MKMSNSPLVQYTKLSPNCNKPRNAKIKKITIHHMAGVLSVETCGRIFAGSGRQASSNYGIGSDGRIGMYVEECNRSWCSSNANNDHQAVTIEVSNCKNGGNWEVSDHVLARLIELCVDICRRNGIERLNYTGDASGNLTRHNMFAATACPGPYLQSKFPYIAEQVNKQLEKDKQPTPQPTVNTTYKVGDKVRFTGILYRDSQGNGAGQSRTNLVATIYLTNPGSKCPYNINNGLGWVRAEDLTPIGTDTPTSNARYYTVVKGDSLWKIAQKFYGNGNRYPEIARANNISNPNIIHAGQRLLIP